MMHQRQTQDVLDLDGNVNGTIVLDGLNQGTTQCARDTTKNLYFIRATTMNSVRATTMRNREQ